jgi:hypothetical protein
MERLGGGRRESRESNLILERLKEREYCGCLGYQCEPMDLSLVAG